MKEKFNSIPPFYQTIILFILGLISFFVLSMIMSVVVDALFPGMVSESIDKQAKKYPIPFMVIYFLPVQLGFILVPGIIYLLLEKKTKSVFRKPSVKYVLLGLLLFASAFFLLPFFSEINIKSIQLLGFFEDLIRLKEASDKQLADLIGEVGSKSYYMALLIVGVIPGIAEELTFRRFLFYHLYKNSTHLLKSIFAAALIFALLHFNYVQIIPLFVFGIVLTVMYYVSGSILPGIFAHSFNNCLNVYWIATDSFPTWMEEITLQITIPSTIVFMGLLLYFFRKNKNL